MAIKKRLIGISLIFFIAMLLSSNAAFSICPKPDYAPNELRSHIRTIIFNFLSDQASSPHSLDEIRDLLEFYRDERGNTLVSDCDVMGTRTDMPISDILAKSIAFVRECNDGFDNDKDGRIDLSDAGCTDLSDEDETNCGDSVCEEALESCSTCSFDCCGFVPSPPLLLIKNAGIDVASFDQDGFLVIKGALQQNVIPVQTSDDEFVIKDNSGNAIAVINLVTGNMAIKGSLFQNQGLLAPASSSDFVVKDASGNVLDYIDSSGNLYLRKSIVHGTPSLTVTQTIQLLQGQNLIGLTVNKGSRYLAENFLNDLNENFIAYNAESGTPPANPVTQIAKLNPSNNKYVTHTLGSPENNFPIVLGAGYFITSTRPGTSTINGETASLSSIRVSTGYSLISFPQQPSGVTTADDLLQSMQSQGVDVREIDQLIGGLWKPHIIISRSLNNFQIRAGEGYLVENKGGRKTYTFIS